MERKELGALGEQLAAEFLISCGLEVLGRNVRFSLGEIDLLMQDHDILVMVEVKTQRSAAFIDPLYKISPAKQRKLRQLGRLVAARYPNRNIRIDAVTVYWKPGNSDPILTHYPTIL